MKLKEKKRDATKIQFNGIGEEGKGKGESATPLTAEAEQDQTQKRNRGIVKDFLRGSLK